MDIHKGFRKYYKSGLVLEQSIGVGLGATFYTLESIWYTEKHGGSFRYYDGANWGIMPSVTAGIGYNLSKKDGTNHFIWVRPKIYWNLGIRGLHLPYAALQIGYTHHIKTNNK